jgi:hypothetical protein
MILGGASIQSHLAMRAEVSRDDDIENADAFTVEIDGRQATVRFSLRHSTRTVSFLGGFTHAVSRSRISYLAGVSLTHVERTFATNAPGLILLPSPSRPDSTIAARVDDFAALSGGADVTLPIYRHFVMLAGVRLQRLALDIDISGYSIRPFVGGAWGF